MVPAELDDAEGAMQDVVLALVFEEGSNRILLVRRRDLVNGSDWAFPGGKREPHEALDVEVAIREVREETGVDCSLVKGPITRRRLRPGGPMIKYVVLRGAGKPVVAEPAKFLDVSWFAPEEVIRKFDGKLLPRVRMELQKGCRSTVFTTV